MIRTLAPLSLCSTSSRGLGFLKLGRGGGQRLSSFLWFSYPCLTGVDAQEITGGKSGRCGVTVD